MKAVAVFPGSREVKVIEQNDPRISEPDQVLLRTLDVGICGTDKEICTFEYGTPPPGDDYLIIGHESLAEVMETGSAVEHFRAGDLVVPSVRRPCVHSGCLACRSGHQHQDYCYTGDFRERGIKEAHGYMAEYIVDQERHMKLVPPDLGEIAVLTGVPGLQAFIEADPARLMRDMVLKNQVLLGTVNAGTQAFASALRNLDLFQRRWPDAMQTLIAGRHPPERATELILGRPTGIKTVIAFNSSPR